VNQFKSIKSTIRLGLLGGFLITLSMVSEITIGATSIAQNPLFVGQALPPKVMLNMSKDHQLFFKAFDDYSDLDGDGIPETTYKHAFNYYGYFDSFKCYKYVNNRFEPKTISADKYCGGNEEAGQWSGNFLNWATMSRMDVIRKILYGGFRSTDATTETVLERAYIPTDAHSWAKFYIGSDLNKLTPYNFGEGLTLCNTTDASTGTSATLPVTALPLIRTARGNFSLWAANERWQCRWHEDVGSPSSGTAGSAGTNGNTASGISGASSTSPVKANSDSKEFNAQVKVCVSIALVGQEKCKSYTATSIKPTGLIQEFGDDDKMFFGLMTGSFQKNKDGGVLRKNVTAFSDEINPDGRFVSPAPAAGGIINTINKLRIVGYQYGSGNGLYNNSQPSGDACAWGLSSFNNAVCRNWGNPQTELLMESLRYLAGKSASTAYSANDTTALAGLTTATFLDPLTSAESCASLNVIQFNASTTSYDADNLPTDLISAAALNTATDGVGAGEIASSSPFFIGENGTDNNQLCTAKTVNPSGSNTLSKLRGTCPDAPRLSGSYQIAGLAHYAHTNDLRSAIPNDQLVKLYGIALSPALPKVEVKVPGSATKTITILPACRNLSTSPSAANCAIVDFKIINQATTATTATGKLYVNWEDSEQGGDFDQDQWGIIEYSITSSNVTITTDVLAQSTPNLMGFGYIINGTTLDGFHVHSGINGFAYADPLGGTTCTNCTVGNAASARTYTIGTSSAKSLEQPLFYAAKWGGFIDSNGNNKPDLQSEWDVSNNGTGLGVPDGIPDKYFAATNPSVLETSLGTALDSIDDDDAAASAVATNSTQLNAGSVVYQAKFSPIDWSGIIEGFSVDIATGVLTSNWITTDPGHFAPYTSRKILTYNPKAVLGARGIAFLWDSLTCPGTATGGALGVCTVGRSRIPGTSQQDYLNKLPPATASDGKGSLRVDWMRGDNTKEKFGRNDPDLTHIFRKRSTPLGDTVNSDPVFVGTDDFGYSTLSGIEGSSYSTFRASSTYLNRRPMLYVGANDGMLHGFDGRKKTTTVTTGGDEILAYVPNAVIPELSKLTSPTYVHQYFVDGLSASGDAYDAVSNKWSTLLVGTTGAGGRAVFALDVTDPDTFGAATSALWEFTDTAPPVVTNCSAFGPTSTDYDINDLGYTLAQPAIARMQNGQWVVIVANGYNSNNGKAVLFILDAKTGCIIRKIDTGAGNTTNKNGLSTPIAVDANNDNSVDTIYAGDLYGNLWKFDVSATGIGSASSWNIPGNSPFFVACTTTGLGTGCPTANRQPITGKPNVGAVGAVGSDQNGIGIMLYFGTGKYFETGDNLPPVSPLVHQVQTFYGLWDRGPAITDRALLQEQIIDFEGFATTSAGTLTTKSIRLVSKNPVCYAGSSVGCTTSSPLKSGWALKLIVGNVPKGERAISFPLVRRGLVVFSTVIPNPDPCGKGGDSRLMEVDALSGGESNGVPFDVTGNRLINADDYIKMTDGTLRVASGIDQGIGITKQPAIVESPTVSIDYKFSSGSTTSMGTIIDKGGDKAPDCTKDNSCGNRRSWRQLNTW
jgi:type IV pilus assembly protein PilY1